MDTKTHPIVQQGIKASALQDQKAYKEEWEYDKACVYYPVHITAEYEAQQSADKVRNDVRI